MADGPISGMTVATAIAKADVFPIVQSGANKQAAVDLLKFAVSADLITDVTTGLTPTTAAEFDCYLMNNAAATTVTIPANATQAFTVGTVLEFYQLGAGLVTFVPDAGVTLRAVGAVYSISGQYGYALLRKIATNEWILKV